MVIYVYIQIYYRGGNGMKRFLALILVLTLVLGVSVSADTMAVKPSDLSGYTYVKSDEALFQVISELYIDGKLESKTTKDYKGNYYAKEISSKTVSDTDASPMGVITYKDFKCYSDVIEDAKALKWNTLGVGVSTTTYFCQWIETWEVDQFGNKLTLVDRKAPTILEADNEYSCIPGYTITRTQWGYTSTKATAAGYTEKVSAGGTTSYTHTSYPVYN